MPTRVEGEQLAPGIGARVHRKLANETAEVVGGVAVGSLTFIGMYGWLRAGGMEPSTALLATAGYAAGMAHAGEVAVSEIKRALHTKGNE